MICRKGSHTVSRWQLIRRLSAGPVREVQLLLNVVEPDPEYQPFVLTDEASVFDAVGHDEDEIRRRLELYFGRPVALDLSVPLWRLVDEIRAWRPGWPEEE